MRTPLLTALVLFASAAQAADVTIDIESGRKPISPNIYGLIGGDPGQLSRMGVTVRRFGGNRYSRFNFKNGTTNEGGDDYFFKNVQWTPADTFVTEAKNAQASSMIELPSIGWVANGPNKCGFSVAKYGPQARVDPMLADCGNGVKMGTDAGVTGNDPADTSVAANEGHAKEMVQSLVNKFGNADNGGVRFYNLMNQPALWSTTHRDVHPQHATYAEISGKLAAYSKAVKDVDPKAQTLGPAAWGWLEYFDSAAGDRAGTGVDFIPFFLQEAKKLEASNGKRMLDYLDLHFYPQATGVSKGETDDATNAMRLRSTKILWDPTYNVESWETCCGEATQKLIPRAKQWIAENYPGTKLAVSGYTWGAIDHWSGALAQVMVLGIFAREGVDLATLEIAPKPNELGEDTFKLFRNYDGQGGKYGSVAVKVSSTDAEKVEVFAAHREDKAITAVVVNKDAAPQKIAFNVLKGAGGSWKAFQFGEAGRLGNAGSGSVANGKAEVNVAAHSAAIVELKVEGLKDDFGDFKDTDPSNPDNPTKPCGCSTAQGATIGIAMMAFVLLRRRNGKK